MGVCVPEELGGAGADFLSYILVLEELSRADAGVGVTVAVHTSAVTLPIVAFGTDEQQQRFVPELAAGRVLGAFALTEAEAGLGCRRAALGGRARRRRLADRRHEAVDHERQPRRHVPRLRAHRPVDRRHPRRQRLPRSTAADVEVTREEEKLGLQLVLDGRHPLRRTRSSGAIGCCTRRTAASRSRWRRSTAGGSGSPRRRSGSRRPPTTWPARYALERRQFGSRIADFQAIQFKLADMATEIAAARLLTYRAAWLKQQGLPHTAEGAQAKLFASAVARRQTGEAIQVLGGYGYTKEFPVERYYRDAKITEIYEGTSEIQRIVIARAHPRASTRAAVAPAAG